MIDSFRKIEREKQSLPDKLREELPGVLNRSLCEPPEVLAAVEDYRAEQDVLRDFLEDVCELGAGYSIGKGDLFAAYLEHCEETHNLRPLGKRTFGAALRERGFDEGKGKTRFWRGITVNGSDNTGIKAPDYYTRGGVETADFIEAKQLNFNLGSAVKYISRAGFKPGNTRLKDLQKALEFLKREIKVEAKRVAVSGEQAKEVEEKRKL